MAEQFVPDFPRRTLLKANVCGTFSGNFPYTVTLTHFAASAQVFSAFGAQGKFIRDPEAPL